MRMVEAGILGRRAAMGLRFGHSLLLIGVLSWVTISGSVLLRADEVIR